MNLKTHLNELKNRIGLVGGPLNLNYIDSSSENINAGIDPSDWHMEININRTWNPVPDRQTERYCRIKKIDNPIKTVLEDLVCHEAGHWDLPRGSGHGCPGIQFPINYHDLILDNVTLALKEDKIEPEQIVGSGQTIAGYLANMIEDTPDNTNCKMQSDFAGQVLFFNEQGISNKKYTQLYELFVKLNMGLWGDYFDKQLLKRFYTEAPEVHSALKTIKEKWNLKVHETLPIYDPKSKEHYIITKSKFEQNHKLLFDKDKWGQFAYAFTKAVIPLLKEMPKERLFGVSESTADKLLEQPKEREKIVAYRNKTGKGISSYMNPFEYLHALYRHLAKAIPVQTESPTISLSFPIADYGKELFDPSAHEFGKIRLDELVIDETGEHLVVSPNQLYARRGVRRPARGFPRFMLTLFDTSDSMREAADGSRDVGKIINPFAPEELQWGDKSKYHFALLGLHGIYNYFEQIGIIQEVDSGLLNFSSAPIFKGMLEFARINEIFKLALTPQFSGTNIDVGVLENKLKEDTFCLSLSDGEIWNWGKVKNGFRKAVEGKMYAQIQYGKENDFTKDLKKWGIPVYFVKNGEDLSRLMVSVTSSQYNQIVKEKMRALAI